MKKITLSFLILFFFTAIPFGVSAEKYPDVNNYIISKNLKAPAIEYRYNDNFEVFNYRYGYGQVEGVVSHETANDSSDIMKEINYMDRNHRNAFVHAFVDHGRIIEIHPTVYGAWGAGRVANQRYIHVELVRVNSFNEFAKSINNYSDYIAGLLYSNKLEIVDAEKTGIGTLWSHNAVSKFLGGTNHVDPHGYFSKWGYNWNDYVNLVTYKYDKLKSSCSGVCWEGFEMEKGQIGRLDVLKPINIWERDENNKLKFIGILPPYKKVNVLQYDSKHGGQYRIGENQWVTNMNGYIKYSTPSKSKLEQLVNQGTESPEFGESTGTGVYWNGREMNVGEIGRLTINKPINLWKRDSSNQLKFVRIVQPGEILSVYGSDTLYGGQFSVGENLWITNMTGYLNYSTPSKSKLEQLAKYEENDKEITPPIEEKPVTTGTGVYWNGREMNVGEIGRLTINKPINLWKRDSSNQLKFVRIVQPGEVLSVYGSDTLYGGQFSVGENLWITNMTGYLNYSTPSKSKLEQLAKYEENDKEITPPPIEEKPVTTGTGVYWNGREMAVGEIGRLTINKPINMWKRDSSNQLKFVRIIQPGEVLSVYGSDTLYGGQFSVGENLWITNMTGYLNYSTPSKSKLDQLRNYEESLTAN